MGGASTVMEWRDACSGQLYNGFPYARWTKTSDNSTIVTEPGVE